MKDNTVISLAMRREWVPVMHCRACGRSMPGLHRDHTNRASRLRRALQVEAEAIEPTTDALSLIRARTERSNP